MSTRLETHPEYLELVGEISVTWAKIHEDLAYFYFNLFEEMRAAAEVSWFSHRSDTAQRRLLRDTLVALPPKHELTVEMRADLFWSISEIGKAAEIRNDAVHTAVLSTWGQPGLRTVVPPWSKDPRSVKLQGTDMHKHLSRCIETIRPLMEFNRLMFSYLSNQPDFSDWPDRPELPVS